MEGRLDSSQGICPSLGLRKGVKVLRFTAPPMTIAQTIHFASDDIGSPQSSGTVANFHAIVWQKLAFGAEGYEKKAYLGAQTPETF